MSIAQVYEHYVTARLFELDLAECMCAIQRLGIIRNPIWVEVLRWIRCMRCPPDVLRIANHRWALELSIAHDEVVRRWGYEQKIRWFANKLLTYDRTHYVSLLEEMLPVVIHNMERFNDIDLNSAINTLLAEYHARGARTYNERLRIRSQEREEWEAARYQEDRKAFAHANGCVYIRCIKSDGIAVGRYLPESELSVFEELFPSAQPDSAEDVCVVCMNAKGEFDCGNGAECVDRLCWNCFHARFVSDKGCPTCRREYIPLAARNVNNNV